LKTSPQIFIIAFILIILPLVNAEPHPDLIITDVFETYTSHYPWPEYYIQIQNIGNITTTNTFPIKINIYRLCFNQLLILRKIYRLTTKPSEKLPPNGLTNILITIRALPNTIINRIIGGTYLLIAEVNPLRTIAESDYTNNCYIQIYNYPEDL
jgi:hypothetical protein